MSARHRVELRVSGLQELAGWALGDDRQPRLKAHHRGLLIAAQLRHIGPDACDQFLRRPRQQRLEVLGVEQVNYRRQRDRLAGAHDLEHLDRGLQVALGRTLVVGSEKRSKLISLSLSSDASP